MSEFTAVGVDVAFLLSNWYSGATLLTLLLDQHPQIVSNGEGFYHPYRTGDTMCSCGLSVRSCRFYREAAAGMWLGSDYDSRLFAVTPSLFAHEPLRAVFGTTRFSGRWRRRLARSVPRLRGEYQRYVQAHVAFMRRAIALSGAQIYLDGTKSLRRAEVFLSEEEFRRSPVLLLVRHPFSWCASWMDKRRSEGLDNAIHTWNEYIRRTFRLRRRFRDAPFRVVLYEQLCADPGSELAEIERWLGVSAEGVLKRDLYTGHILGNDMRFRFDGTVRAAADRSGELSGDERAQILKRCEKWMMAVGYTAAASPRP